MFVTSQSRTPRRLCGSVCSNQAHVIGRKEAAVAIGADAAPPALIDLLDLTDDVAGVEGNLVLLRRREVIDGFRTRALIVVCGTKDSLESGHPAATRGGA